MFHNELTSSNRVVGVSLVPEDPIGRGKLYPRLYLYLSFQVQVDSGLPTQHTDGTD